MPSTALFPHGLPSLETQRLFLRPFREADLEDVFAYASDPETTRFVRFETHPDRAATQAWLRGVLAKEAEAPWALELKEDGRVIGSLGARDWEPVNRCAEIGFVLNRNHWGEGLVSEALRAAVDDLFAHHRANRLQAHAMVENAASGLVLTKCGFTLEGIARQRVFLKGAFRDISLFALLRDDWERQRGARG
jgi:ribosomal-protein-alanine N-acetyltransferase